MTKFFNANPIGFFDDNIQKIPKEAKEITDSQWQSLLESQSKGQIIEADLNGNPIAVDKPTLIPTVEYFNDATQNKLDSFAQSWGYDSLISAISYVNSTNTQYKTEAEALIAWRDAVWTKAYTIEAGTLPATVNDFLIQLPAAPARPII